MPSIATLNVFGPAFAPDSLLSSVPSAVLEQYRALLLCFPEGSFALSTRLRRMFVRVLCYFVYKTFSERLKSKCRYDIPNALVLYLSFRILKCS